MISSPSHTVLHATLPQIARIPRGFSTVLPCWLLGWSSHVLLHERCHLLSRDGVTVGRVGTPTFFTICLPSSRRAMWGRGQVCLDLMSLTRPHGDETAGGSTQCWLGCCLVSLFLRLMAEYSPNDPLRCGLNSTTSKHLSAFPGSIGSN